jgi:hypothetical protein
MRTIHESATGSPVNFEQNTASEGLSSWRDFCIGLEELLFVDQALRIRNRQRRAAKPHEDTSAGTAPRAADANGCICRNVLLIGGRTDSCPENTTIPGFLQTVDANPGRPSFHICIPQEFGPPFLVLLACDLSGGISPFQELYGRLHFPVSRSAHRHHERKEHNPKEDPEDPPKPMHSPKIVVHHLTPEVRCLSFRAWCQ